MAKIEIKITIPDYEYKEWNEFEQDGEKMCAMSIRKLISDRLTQDYIRHFDIETYIDESK